MVGRSQARCGSQPPLDRAQREQRAVRCAAVMPVRPVISRFSYRRTLRSTCRQVPAKARLANAAHAEYGHESTVLVANGAGERLECVDAADKVARVGASPQSSRRADVASVLVCPAMLRGQGAEHGVAAHPAGCANTCALSWAPPGAAEAFETVEA